MKQFYRLFAAIGLGVILTSCGGGGGGQAAAPSAGQVVLNPVVKSVGSGAATTVVSSDPNSMTLTGDLSKITTGSVLVGTDGNGTIRKVASTTVSGSNLVCQTTPGILTDAVQSGDVAMTKQFSGEELSALVSPTPHVKPQVSPVGGGLYIPISNLAIDPDGLVVLNGSLTLNLSADFHAVIKFPGRLKSVRFVPTISLTGQLTASVGGADGRTISGSYSLPLGPTVPIGPPIFVGPIALVPEGQLVLVANVSASGQASWSPSFQATCGAGIEWDAGSNSVKPITTHSAKFNLTPPANVSFDGKVDIALQPSISLLIEGVVGPTVTASVPDISGSLGFTISPPPASAYASIDAALKASASLKYDIFGFSGDFDLPGELSYSLYSWNHTWTDSGVLGVAIVGDWAGTLVDAGTSGFQVGFTENDQIGSDGINHEDSNTYSYSYNPVKGVLTYTAGSTQAYYVVWTDQNHMVWTNTVDGRIYDFVRNLSPSRRPIAKGRFNAGSNTGSRSSGG